MKFSRSLYFMLAALFVSCASKPAKYDFYSYTKSHDLWRLPLLEPYELISPTNSGDWFLVLENQNFKNKDFLDLAGEFQLSNIDSVGILDSVIAIHSSNTYWPKLSGSYNTTLIIDTKTQNKFIYSNQHHNLHINNKLQELEIKSIKLFPLESVLKSFQSNMTLPKEWN